MDWKDWFAELAHCTQDRKVIGSSKNEGSQVAEQLKTEDHRKSFVRPCTDFYLATATRI